MPVTSMSRAEFVRGTIQYALCWNDKWTHRAPGDRPQLREGGRTRLKHTVAVLSAMAWEAANGGDRRMFGERLGQILTTIGRSVFVQCGSFAACDTLRSMMEDLGFPLRVHPAERFERELIESLETGRPIAEIARQIAGAYEL